MRTVVMRSRELGLTSQTSCTVSSSSVAAELDLAIAKSTLAGKLSRRAEASCNLPVVAAGGSSAAATGVLAFLEGALVVGVGTAGLFLPISAGFADADVECAHAVPRAPVSADGALQKNLVL